MKFAIILNGISRKKKFFYGSLLSALQTKFDCTVFETKYNGHASELARLLPDEFTAVLAAGGDGTLHEVLNGIMRRNSPLALGIIPLGSGNDFAATCGVRANVSSMLHVLNGLPKPTDIGKISCTDDNGNLKHEFFLNVCSVGMGPNTVTRMAQLPTWLGAHGKYLSAIILTFLTDKAEEIQIEGNCFEWKGNARVIAVANGKSFGNKIYIAPHAQIDDGLLNLFVGGDVPLPKFLWYLQQMKNNREVNARQIRYCVADDLRLSSARPTKLEADGELVGWLPATIRMVTNCINMLR
ncbi:MAG: diacylglycerol/lipid kinase family protein [Cytophagales bacterium]